MRRAPRLGSRPLETKRSVPPVEKLASPRELSADMEKTKMTRTLDEAELLILEADDALTEAWDAAHPEYVKHDFGEYQVCKLCGGTIQHINDSRREHRPDCIYVRTHDALVEFANALEEAEAS